MCPNSNQYDSLTVIYVFSLVWCYLQATLSFATLESTAPAGLDTKHWQSPVTLAFLPPTTLGTCSDPSARTAVLVSFAGSGTPFLSHAYRTGLWADSAAHFRVAGWPLGTVTSSGSLSRIESTMLGTSSLAGFCGSGLVTSCTPSSNASPASRLSSLLGAATTINLIIKRTNGYNKQFVFFFFKLLMLYFLRCYGKKLRITNFDWCECLRQGHGAPLVNQNRTSSSVIEPLWFIHIFPVIRTINNFYITLQ